MIHLNSIKFIALEVDRSLPLIDSSTWPDLRFDFKLTRFTHIQHLKTQSLSNNWIFKEKPKHFTRIQSNIMPWVDQRPLTWLRSSIFEILFNCHPERKDSSPAHSLIMREGTHIMLFAAVNTSRQRNYNISSANVAFPVCNVRFIKQANKINIITSGLARVSFLCFLQLYFTDNYEPPVATRTMASGGKCTRWVEEAASQGISEKITTLLKSFLGYTHEFPIDFRFIRNIMFALFYSRTQPLPFGQGCRWVLWVLFQHFTRTCWLDIISTAAFFIRLFAIYVWS